MLTLGELFKVKVIFCEAFHKLKHEPSLKSLWQLDAQLFLIKWI